MIAGVVVMLVGADLIVRGVHTLLGAVRLSETFLGMAVVGMGESLEDPPGSESGADRAYKRQKAATSLG